MDALKQDLRNTIEERVFVQAKSELISDGMGEELKDGWLFDFRRIIMQGKSLDTICTLFIDSMADTPSYQVCGLEVAAIPLVTGVTQLRHRNGITNANGFFIRKSRKKSGLLRMIEGIIDNGTPIILIDDICNEGKSFLRQVEVLEQLGHSVKAVWSILQFRDESFYVALKEKNITVKSIFTLNDFSDTLKIKNLVKKNGKPLLRQAHSINWKFVSKNPNLFWVVPKSTPALFDEKIYFGSDNGTFWALRQSDGSVVWSYKVGYKSKGKSIFSAPIIHGGIVYFGSYDGNVYALNAQTGTVVWVSFDGDYVGSSPVIAGDLGLLFIGLEFGIWNKKGGIIALSLKTGNKVWWDESMPNFTHATPVYIPGYKEVAIGSNDGVVRLYDARTGILKWKAKTGDPSPTELSSGFSAYDIKSSIAYDPTLEVLVTPNMNGDAYAFKRSSGETAWNIKVEFGIYGTPVIYKRTVIFASLDKNVYSANLSDGKILWKTPLRSRIFASPYIYSNTIIIGSNAGTITILDAENGVELGQTTLTERVTNAVVANVETRNIFVLTYANELYCLSEREKSPDNHRVNK